MREAYVFEAEVELAPGTDPAALGAAITIELCGHWEHEGACRWPHNSEIAAESSPAVLRTIFVATPEDSNEVRDRIGRALTGWSEWNVVDTRTRDLHDDEQALASRLVA